MYHRNSFASFEAGTSLTLTLVLGDNEYHKHAKVQREYRECNIILLFTALYSLFFCMWDVGLASNAYFFLSFSINPHHSSAWALGHGTNVTQLYMPFPPLAGLMASPEQLECARNLTADWLYLQTLCTQGKLQDS